MNRIVCRYTVFLFIYFPERLSFSSSPNLKRHSLDQASPYHNRSSSSLSHQPCGFLRPSSAQPGSHQRRRLSDNHFRGSVTSQTSSLHTALSELAGDVEVLISNLMNVYNLTKINNCLRRWWIWKMVRSSRTAPATHAATTIPVSRPSVRPLNHDF